jgi:molybdenum cofactor cytidylyltransferase
MEARVGAVVLAAGASTRMGQPKALIVWRGRAFVRHVVDRAQGAGIEPIVVVQGAVPLPDDAVHPAVLVHNASWASGQLGSLQQGLAALPRDTLTGVLVLTVDRPHLEVATLLALLTAHRSEPHQLWQPTKDGHTGHPILFPIDVVDDLLALPAGDSARTVVRRADVAARRKSIEVDDPAVLDNIDCPEDLARLPTS